MADEDDSLQRAVAAAGGRRKVAEALGITTQAVHSWFLIGIPAERVLDMERLCDAEVTRYDLAPKLYPRRAKA